MPSTISGTQSPPLEATGEHKPMGQSSVSSEGQKVDVVPDAEQRKQYFSEDSKSASDETSRAAGGVRKMGESLADKLEKRD
ncbi:hypothetical protein D9758_011431 [Tetrapyrgos nigripes]|uniref:Uncharacterized protein n=1 Tax=Tetrapyrgos nigripes TaxID=182062 RepID=A0A8H5FR15_9AGAR|nr:hypothetical protein D9758_011431 [Tetrapyrgos nigripes]